MPVEEKPMTTPANAPAAPQPRRYKNGSHPGGHWFYRLVCWGFRMIGKFWLRQELIGLDNVPKTGPALIVPTHCSYVDPPLVGANILRECHYLSRDGILKVPLLGWVSQTKLNAHPIRRGASDREAIRTCRGILKEGLPLLFFPEGTRSRDGKLLPLQGGFAMILDGLGIPYIPVMVQSSYRILPRGAFFLKPLKLTIIYGKPTYLPERLEGEATRDFIKRCCEKLEAEYRAMGAQ